jgi:hypothetical protein
MYAPESPENLSHLVCLVVVLRVVLENFGLLGVLKVANELVEIEVLAPLLAVHKPILS